MRARPGTRSQQQALSSLLRGALTRSRMQRVLLTALAQQAYAVPQDFECAWRRCVLTASAGLIAACLAQLALLCQCEMAG